MPICSLITVKTSNIYKKIAHFLNSTMTKVLYCDIILEKPFVGEIMYEIMMVDDDSTNLAIGKALLGPEFKVVTMKSGIQALGYLQTYKKPDIILLDFVMPGTNGAQVLKAMQKDKKLCDIPVMFLTSSESLDDEIEGLAMGAVDYIRKPIVPEILKLKIHRQVAFLKLQQENELLKQKLENIKKEVDSVIP